MCGHRISSSTISKSHCVTSTNFKVLFENDRLNAQSKSATLFLCFKFSLNNTSVMSYLEFTSKEYLPNS